MAIEAVVVGVGVEVRVRFLEIFFDVACRFEALTFALIKFSGVREKVTPGVLLSTL